MTVNVGLPRRSVARRSAQTSASMPLRLLGLAVIVDSMDLATTFASVLDKLDVGLHAEIARHDCKTFTVLVLLEHIALFQQRPMKIYEPFTTSAPLQI